MSESYGTERPGTEDERDENGGSGRQRIQGEQRGTTAQPAGQHVRQHERGSEEQEGYAGQSTQEGQDESGRQLGETAERRDEAEDEERPQRPSQAEGERS